MRIAGREADRDPCLGVIVSTAMMKQPSSPPCHDDRSQDWLGNPSPDTFLLSGEDMKAVQNHEYFSVFPLWLKVCLSDGVVHLLSRAFTMTPNYTFTEADDICI